MISHKTIGINPNFNIILTLFSVKIKWLELETMANTEDKLFYAGYGFVVIMLGLLVMLFSIGFLDGWTAFGLWLLSLSLILVGLGNVRTESAPHGSRAMVGIGLFFTIISIAVLGIILQWFTPLTAFALLIVLIGLGILGMSIKRPKSTT
jgi:hypothetical protein